jgi:hypothetical protein
MSTSASRASHLALISTTSTSKPPFLHRRGKLYCFKRKVPADCRELFGEHRQVWKSLGTDKLEKAKVITAVEVTEFDLAVARHRKERAALAAGVVPMSQDRPNAVEILAPEGETSRAAFAYRDVLQSIEAAVEPFRGLMVPQVAPSPAVVPTAATVRTTPAVPQPGRRTTSKRRRIPPTLLPLFEDWKRKQTRPSTIGAVQTAVLEFHELHGSLPIETINRQHARDYRDALIERRLSDGTSENRIGFLSTLVRHDQMEMVEHVLANPFERIEIYGGQGLLKPNDRRAFNIGELNLIFASKLYTRCEGPYGQASEAAYWAPLMGPFVGARIEEVPSCASTTSSVSTAAGACASATSVKSRTSRMLVASGGCRCTRVSSDSGSSSTLLSRREQVRSGSFRRSATTTPTASSPTLWGSGGGAISIASVCPTRGSTITRFGTRFASSAACAALKTSRAMRSRVTG